MRKTEGKRHKRGRVQKFCGNERVGVEGGVTG